MSGSLHTLMLLAVFCATPPNPGTEAPRIFVAPSDSWVGGAPPQLPARPRLGSILDATLNPGVGGGGARPQTAEIVKTFGERCRSCVLTTQEQRADYVVSIEHEGGKSPLRKDTKYFVATRDGDVLHSGSARSIGSAVKEICKVIAGDWTNRKPSSAVP